MGVRCGLERVGSLLVLVFVLCGCLESNIESLRCKIRNFAVLSV